MKTIIAPTDFSATSLNAVDYAADLAAAIHADLILLHVVQVPLTVSEVIMPEPAFEEMVEQATEDLNALAVRLAVKIKGRINISSEIKMGDTEHQIKEMTNDKKPFALVMGIKSGSSIKRFFIGSNTLSVEKHLYCPVLIIPENVHFDGINKIGLACDLQHVATTLPFKALQDWLSAFHATLDIIHVSKKEGEESALTGECISVHNHLNRFQPEFNFLTGDNLAESLQDFVKQHSIDLLIIIPKRHGLLEIFDEKHAKKVVTHQNIPVLSIHAVGV